MTKGQAAAHEDGVSGKAILARVISLAQAGFVKVERLVKGARHGVVRRHFEKGVFCLFFGRLQPLASQFATNPSSLLFRVDGKREQLAFSRYRSSESKATVLCKNIDMRGG